MPCITNCVDQYVCRGIVSVLPGAVYAPFIEVGFRGGIDGDTIITVGNESAPKPADPFNEHHAVIKSFEYGKSNGQGVSIEIFDEDGGDFAFFMTRLNKAICRASDEYTMRVEFGWIIQECDGSTRKVSSGGLFFLPIEIQAAYEQGKIKFVLTGTDMMDRIGENRTTDTQGSDSDPIALKDAINRLFSQGSPRVPSVRFLRKENGITSNWNFSQANGGEKGPRGVWPADQQNQLSTARNWLQPFTTDRGEGIVPEWNCTTPGGEIIYWADNVDTEECRGSIGTYIVNGGNCLWYGTSVLTEYGWKQIAWIVNRNMPCKVACVDEKFELTWSEVTNWYQNDLGNRKMIKINLHNSLQKEGGTFTDDHQILTNNGWKRVNQLDPSIDLIHSGTDMPSKEVHEAVLGMILGKGAIKNKTFHCSHFEEKYAEHQAELLGVEVKKKYQEWKVRTATSPYWIKMKQLFYEGWKVINEENLDGFSLISLAYLYMDCGDLQTDESYYTAYISAIDFEESEIELLVGKIKEIGINCRHEDSIIYFDKEQTTLLSKEIAPYVIPEFNYKLKVNHREIPKQLISHGTQPFYDNFDLVRCESKEKCKSVYCIDVAEFHNFITNSGVVHNCSPVLSFNPQVKWTFVANAGSGGTAGGGFTGGTDVLEGNPGVEPAGTQSQTTPPAWLNNSVAPDNILRQHSDAFAAHEQANRSLETRQPIEAELKVQGDPALVNPIFLRGAWISIVVINPFHIKNNFLGNLECGDWLAQPVCNRIFSNKKWMIKEVNHQIKEGSYVTILKVFLAAPNTGETPANAPAGNNSSGFTFENGNCDFLANPGGNIGVQ